MDPVQRGGPWTRSKEVVHGPSPKRWSMDPVQRGGPWTWGPGFVLSLRIAVQCDHRRTILCSFLYSVKPLSKALNRQNKHITTKFNIESGNASHTYVFVVCCRLFDRNFQVPIFGSCNFQRAEDFMGNLMDF